MGKVFVLMLKFTSKLFHMFKYLQSMSMPRSQAVSTYPVLCLRLQDWFAILPQIQSVKKQGVQMDLDSLVCFTVA